MENKKTYIKPEIKSVEFKAEQGFAASGLTQNTRRMTDDERSLVNGNPFNVHWGVYGNNDEDWD